MAASEEQFLSLEDVASRLQVSDQTVRRWIKAGKLAAYKPGLEYRIKASDLEEFLKTREVSPKVRRRPEEEEEHRTYPYPWMAQALAGLLATWDEQVTSKENPAQSRTIVVSALDVEDAVILSGATGRSAWEALPDYEKAERKALAAWLEELAMRGHAHYKESKEAQKAELEALEKRREEIKRRTAEIAS
jgi:excisionase family DNA binding protein